MTMRSIPFEECCYTVKVFCRMLLENIRCRFLHDKPSHKCPIILKVLREVVLRVCERSISTSRQSFRRQLIVKDNPNRNLVWFRATRVPCHLSLHLYSQIQSLSLSFNSKAGPTLAFGLGPRKCFGQKLAFMQIRNVVALLLWNFRFTKMEGRLASREAKIEMSAVPKYCYVALERVHGGGEGSICYLAIDYCNQARVKIPSRNRYA